MKILKIEPCPAKDNEERLTWHKPEVQELEVSLDTAQKAGSFVDGTFGATFPPPP